MSRPSSQTNSSGGGGGTSRSYPQDYIVRIRYQNPLPPPPNPPKLLDIPNPAVATYTSTGFASKLAREQPLNIELDSELGMPLSLVHIPSVFDRDESPLHPIHPAPPIHPSDRLLLRPASALGKAARINTGGASGVSFLRRTEYISNETSRLAYKSTTSASLITSAPLAKKVRSLAQKAEEESDPVRILAAVMRGFDIANPETVGAGYVAKPVAEDRSIKLAEENWRNLKHPTRKGVKPAAVYPVLPDPDALGELNGYLVYKFSTDPLGSVAVRGRSAEPSQGGGGTSGGGVERDERMDVALMRIRYLTDEMNQKNAASQNPSSQSQSQSQQPVKEGQMTLDFYIPEAQSPNHTRQLKRKFVDVEGKFDTPEERENPENPSAGYVYRYIRAYDQHATKDLLQSTEVALVLHDTDSHPSSSHTTTSTKRKVKKERHDEDDGDGLFGSEDEGEEGGSEGPEAGFLQHGMCGRKKPKGAYWYPVVWRSVLKPKRNEKMAEGFFRPTIGARVKATERDVEEEGRYDLLNVTVRGLTEEERIRTLEGAKRFLSGEKEGGGAGGL